MTKDSPSQRHAEIDLLYLLRILRWNWLLVLVISLVSGVIVFSVSNEQQRTFRASGSVMAISGDVGNAVADSNIVATPPLPQGAVAELVTSQSFAASVIKSIQGSEIDEINKLSIIENLEREIDDGTISSITVRARLDSQQRGIYEVRGEASTPEGAQLLADTAIRELLRWDTERAKQSITRATNTLEQQLKSIENQSKSMESNAMEMAALAEARGQIALNLSQLRVFESTVTGSLALLVDAYAAPSPISPKPFFSASLGAALAFISSFAALILFDITRQRVRSSSELEQFGIPVLGELPKLRKIKRSTTVGQTMNGDLYEPASFIRVNTEGLLNSSKGVDIDKNARTLVVTSAKPGEGKSTTIAAMATSYAAAGDKVLVIDLDIHRPTQHEFWGINGKPWVSLRDGSLGQAMTSAEALRSPETASALVAGHGIYIIPASRVGRRDAAFFQNDFLSQRLQEWSKDFDVILLDTAPVLSVADALFVGRYTDGLVLVVQSSVTGINEIERLVNLTKSAQVSLIGFVLNRVDQQHTNYGYGYARADS